MAFIRRSVEHFGQLNILVNNAIKAGDNTIQSDTTKTAVTGLTRSLARAYADDGIRANALCPGPTFSPFHGQRAATAGQTHKEFKEEFGRPFMLKRPATDKKSLFSRYGHGPVSTGLKQRLHRRHRAKGDMRRQG